MTSLTAKHKSYPAYKSSGVDWLGSVPAHWEVARLKSHVANITDKTDVCGADEIYLALENVESWTGKLREVGKDVSFDSQVKRFQVGDVLFGKLRPYLAKVASPKCNGVCVSEFLVLRGRSVGLMPKYLAYLLLSRPIIDAINSATFGAKMPRADWQFIGGMVQPFPSLAEQRSIVAFLDRETAKIDALVSKKERLIELLQEKRTALISHTVTKGLDPNAPMKDSGVEWMGDVPAHWEVKRLKVSVTDCVGGVWGSEPNGLDDLPCVRVADFDRHRLRVYMHNSTLRAIAPNDRRRRVLNPDDLLLEKSGGGDLQPVGVVMLYDHDALAVCSNFIARLRIAVEFDPVFLTFLHSALYAIRLNTRSIKQTTGIQNLDIPAYLREMVCFPPLSEQRAIAAFLDRETAKLDNLFAQVQKAIELLKELRTALVSAAVNGKIDVREEAGCT